MGGKGGGSKVQYVSTPSTTNQTQKLEPWGPTAQPLQNLMNEALSQYYSEPSVVGYRAPTTRQVPIYEDIPVTTTYSGAQVTADDLYGHGGRFQALPTPTRDAIANTLERMVATESGLRFGHTPGLMYLDPQTRDANARYWSGVPSSGPYAQRGAMLRVQETDIRENPIAVINQLGFDVNDVLKRAGVGQTAQTSGGGRRISGYRTETTPGQEGVYIAPETRMLADFLSNEAMNRAHYTAPIDQYADYINRAVSGQFDLDRNNYMLRGDYGVRPEELIQGDYGIRDPELMRWEGGINPYAEDMYRQMSENVQSQVMGAMNMAGRHGSGSNTRILSEELGDLATRFYTPIYEAEQGRRYGAEQQNAAAQAAAIRRQMEAEAANAAAQSGAVQRAMQAEALNQQYGFETDKMNRLLREQSAQALPNVLQARRDVTDWIGSLLQRSGDLRKSIQDQPNIERAAALQRAMAAITPLSGIGGITTVQGSGNQQTPYFSNPMGSALGGALMGAQLPGMFGLTGGLASGLGAGLGALAMFSGEQYKDDIQEFDPNKVMDGFRQMNVKTWRYKPEMGMGTDKHVGPIAQDFNKSFGIDTPRDDMIGVIDAIGVTMAGIKNIDERLRKAGV